VNLLDRLTEPDGAVTTFAYDANHHRTRTTYPNGVVQTQGYDGPEHLTSIAATNAAGTVTSYTYDYGDTANAKDRALVQTGSEAIRQVDGFLATRSVSWSYDSLGRLTLERSLARNNGASLLATTSLTTPTATSRSIPETHLAATSTPTTPRMRWRRASGTYPARCRCRTPTTAPGTASRMAA
jgi:YD repeat-containing protein